MINFILNKLGLIKKSEVVNNLHYMRSVAKRLDEHRELVENLEKSGFFETYFWHIGHTATQDDYLMRLYYMAYNQYPDENGTPSKDIPKYGYVRKRPAILGNCYLPEYKKNCIKE